MIVNVSTEISRMNDFDNDVNRNDFSIVDQSNSSICSFDLDRTQSLTPIVNNDTRRKSFNLKGLIEYNFKNTAFTILPIYYRYAEFSNEKINFFNVNETKTTRAPNTTVADNGLIKNKLSYFNPISMFRKIVFPRLTNNCLSPVSELLLKINNFNYF